MMSPIELDNHVRLMTSWLWDMVIPLCLDRRRRKEEEVL